MLFCHAILIRGDMKSEWQNIKSVLNRTKAKKKQFPDKFKLDAQLLTDRFEIANQFNTFFVNIGTKHTENIVTPPKKSYKDYLTSPCEISFNLRWSLKVTLTLLYQN